MANILCDIIQVRLEYTKISLWVWGEWGSDFSCSRLSIKGEEWEGREEGALLQKCYMLVPGHHGGLKRGEEEITSSLHEKEEEGEE